MRLALLPNIEKDEIYDGWNRSSLRMVETININILEQIECFQDDQWNILGGDWEVIISEKP